MDKAYRPTPVVRHVNRAVAKLAALRLTPPDTLARDTDSWAPPSPMSLHPSELICLYLAKRLFEQISEMEQALIERCVQLLDQAETIKDLTRGRSERRIGRPRDTKQPCACPPLPRVFFKVFIAHFPA
jgi:hypothetical protein